MKSTLTLPDELGPGSIAVIGIPYDSNSSFLRGPALAPRRIREVLHSGMLNWSTETGIDLSARTEWRDLGDLDLSAGNPIEAIEAAARGVVERGVRLLSLGGDHAVTYPLICAHAAAYPGLTLLHIDAHLDLYDNFDDNPYSHASPFARIMEAGLVRRLVQVGIRAMNPHQREQVERFGVEVVSMRDFRSDLDLGLEAPVYVSLDLDGLDPAYAPGVSHHEPGGLSVREVLNLLWRIEAPIVGADLVEYNPVRDHADMTAAVASKFHKELLGLLLR